MLATSFKKSAIIRSSGVVRESTPRGCQEEKWSVDAELVVVVVVEEANTLKGTHMAILNHIKNEPKDMPVSKDD